MKYNFYEFKELRKKELEDEMKFQLRPVILITIAFVLVMVELMI